MMTYLHGSTHPSAHAFMGGWMCRQGRLQGRRVHPRIAVRSSCYLQPVGCAHPNVAEAVCLGGSPAFHMLSL
jgi:hypothetical protein